MSFIAITGDALFLSLFLIFGIIVTLIFGIRKYIQYQKNKIQPNTQNLSERNKYALVNTFKMSRTLFNVGLFTALTMTILAFSWTTYDYEKPTVILDPGDIEDVTVIERTIQNPPPPPPPPPSPVIIPEIVEPDAKPEDIEFVAVEIVEPELVVAPLKPEVEKVIPTPPPLSLPPEKEPEVTPIHVIVEEMPRFPGCESLSDREERKKCAQQNMLKYIYEEINYPTAASEVGIEGTVVVRFYIDEKGYVKKPEILKEIGGGCGKEALRVIEKMNKLSERWTPGRQGGRAVKVYFNLPVRYKLN